MLRTIFCLAIVACLLSGRAQADPSVLTIDQLFDFCQAPSVPEAAAKGDRLGWQRLDEAKVEEWRQSFVRYNGGSVDVVAWKRGEMERGDSLSFWIAEGPNGHRACAYSAADASGLLEALSQRIGKPDSLDRNDVATSAHWTTGSNEIYYAQVGTGAIVNISTQD